ncbi:MAG: hypothetical protein WA114_08100 [Psychrobacter glacincola]
MNTQDFTQNELMLLIKGLKLLLSKNSKNDPILIKEFYVRSDPYMEVFAVDKEKYEEDRNNIIDLVRKLEKN